MNFRWTISELRKVNTDNPEEFMKFVVAVLEERKGSLTNVYSPLYRTLGEVQEELKNATIIFYKK